MLTRRKSEINQWISLPDVVDLTYDVEEEQASVSKQAVLVDEGVSSKTVSSTMGVSSVIEVSSPTQLPTPDLRPLIKQMTTELQESTEHSSHETKRKNKTKGRNRRIKPRVCRKRKKESSSTGMLYGKNDELVGSELDVQSDDRGEESNSEDMVPKQRNEKEKIILHEKEHSNDTEAEMQNESVETVKTSSPPPQVSRRNRSKPSHKIPAEEVTPPSKPTKETNRGVTVVNLNKNGQTMEVVVASGKKRAPKEIEYLYSMQSQELEEKEKRRLLRDEHMRRIEEKRYKAMLADAEKEKKKKEKKEKKVKKEKTKSRRKLTEKKSVRTQETEILSPVEPLIPLNDQPEPHSFILASPQNETTNSLNPSNGVDSSLTPHISEMVHPSGLVLSNIPDDGFTESFVQIAKEIPVMTMEQPLFTISQPERSESFQDICTVNPATVRALSPSRSPSV